MRSDGFVYFVEAIGVHAIKIGWAISPKRRLIQHQIGCPLILVLLAAAPGSLASEGAIQRKFSTICIRGEWYSADPVLLSLIESVRISGRLPEDYIHAPVSPNRPYTPARELIVRVGGAPALARMLEVRNNLVNQWQARGTIPGWWYKKIIDACALHGIIVTPEDFFSASFRSKEAA